MPGTAKLSTKGQIVIPLKIRIARRWRPGTEFNLEERRDGLILRPRVKRTARGWEALVGIVRYRGPRLSLAAAAAATEECAPAESTLSDPGTDGGD